MAGTRMICLSTTLLLVFASFLAAETTYRRPPPEVARMVEAKPLPAVTVDPTHGPADAYVVFLSDFVKADQGFTPLVTVTATATSVALPPASAAYEVAAENCAGLSSTP